MKKICLVTATFLLMVFCHLSAQPVKIPLTLDNWDTIGVKPVTETYLGKECFLIPSGMIVAKAVELRDGTIEADISFPRKRSFPGFRVRMQDDTHFENFYVRPH